MKQLQPIHELETWWEQPDPWEYENNPDDLYRRAMLLSVLPRKKYKRVLDIGCGNGFVTQRLPGDDIVAVDISANAICHARKHSLSHIHYHQYSLFQLPQTDWKNEFDLIVITGVLYAQYVGRSNHLIYLIIDNLLKTEGDLVCCHIEEWYSSRFPYVTLVREFYSYRDYVHILEVYRKL